MSDGVQTAEVAKQEHIAHMGEELGTVYATLWQQVASLHAKWADFVALFGTSESRVELLNKAAPVFFRHVQDGLWEGILLHVARLTDPPMSGGKQNLTICRLPALIRDAKAKADVEHLISGAIRVSTFARDWRNRHIAHSDLDLSTNQSPKTLEFASRELVNQSLTALEAVLNGVARHFDDRESSFAIGDWDALWLLHVIDDGLRAVEQGRDRLLAGQSSAEAFKRRVL
jgi:AbiU2